MSVSRLDLDAKHYNFLNTPHRGVEEVINQRRI